MLSNTRPFIDELERALPSRPFAVELWDGTRLASTNGGGGPTFRVRSPDALAHALRAPGQLGLGRAYVSGALAVDDLDEVLELLDSWEPPPLDRRAQARLALAAVRATGLVRPPAVPKTELRPRGRRHSPERDAPLGAPPLRRVERLLPAHARRVDDLQLRPVLTRSDHARGGPGGEARAGLHEARAELRAARARHRLRVGQLRHPRRARTTACTSPASRCPSRRPRSRADAREERGLADSVDIRVMDYRELGGERFDAVASIGMVEHVGSTQIDVYARQVARLREARRARAEPRHRPAAGGRSGGRPVLGALRVPGRGAAPPLAHPVGARARRARDRARRGSPHATTRRRSGTGRRTSTTTSTRPPASPAPSASASGASTCAPRGAASRAASPRSTRCAALGPDRDNRFA